MKQLEKLIELDRMAVSTFDLIVLNLIKDKTKPTPTRNIMAVLDGLKLKSSHGRLQQTLGRLAKANLVIRTKGMTTSGKDVSITTNGILATKAV